MKIAIIGTGISGLTAARLLAGEHDLTLYEAGPRPGGHTHTVAVPVNGTTYAVDTGFIVFNDRTYPDFVRLMQRIGVARRRSEMSFSVSCRQTGLEYRPSTLDTLFAQRANLRSPGFLRMVLEIFRFRRVAPEILRTVGDGVTIGEYLSTRRYSERFIRHFIVPMGAAIWSAEPERFLEFPIRYFVTFFTHHGFLEIRNQPQWYVIEGGSSAYIPPLTAPFRERIRCNAPVRRVTRSTDHVTVQAEGAPPERFDQVIIATHSDQALALLGDPSPAEREILGGIPYQENAVTLHTDTGRLPRNRRTWASWNYRIPAQPARRATVTYNMNILQTLSAPVTFCVSLNQQDAIDPRHIIGAFTYHHPVYTPSSLALRRRREEISGVGRTWYCGAYWGFGFHEDGVKSALAVCRHFGKEIGDA